MQQAKFVPLSHRAYFPTKGSIDSVGYDIYASEDVLIGAGDTIAISTGLGVRMPSDFHAKIESRSSLSCKGVIVVGGVIDSDYKGEVKVILHNQYVLDYNVHDGDRIAQLIFFRKPPLSVEADTSTELSFRSHSTLRRSNSLPTRVGGFGSTGV